MSVFSFASGKQKEKTVSGIDGVKWVRSSAYMKICLLGSPVELMTEFIEALGIGIPSTDYLNTTGCTFSTIRKHIDSMRVSATLYLINPSEVFKTVRPLYFRNSLAALILFDTQDRQSFQSAEQCSKEIRKFITEPIPFIPIFLVGIQGDTPVISMEEVKTLTDQYKMHYYETAPNDSLQITHIMTELIRQVLGRF